MELKNIEAFLKIADCGSFSMAAELLFISQSTISNRIHVMEQELNTSLFSRNNGRRVTLTPDAEVIYPLLKQAMNLIHSARITIAQSANQAKEFKVSFPAHMAEQIFLELSKVIHQQFPQYEVSFKLYISPLAIKVLANGLLDMVFGYFQSPPIERDMGVEHIADIETVIICSPHHPILKKSIHQLSDLKNERIIIYNKAFPTYQIFEKFLIQNNVPTDLKIVEVQRIDLIKQMVMKQEGISLIQKSSVIDELKNNQLSQVQFDQVLPKTPIYFIYNKGTPQNLIQLMISFAKEFYNPESV